MDEELKPCPFCGGDELAADNGFYDTYHWYIHCKNCGASCGDGEEKSAAEHAWNRRADGWIAVSERLPKDTKPVLISDDAEADHVGYYSGTDWWQRNGMVQINARYWQPLPAAPKAGER